MQSNHTWWWKEAEPQWHTSQVSQNLWRIPRDSETNKIFFLWKMFNFFYYMEIPCSSLTTRRENSIFHIRNKGSIGLMRIMSKWVEWSWPNNMATNGFNDGHHWLSNGLLHVWCHAIICHAMYLSIEVWETNQLHSGLGSIPIFQFNSNSIIFNSNSNSTTRNKF